MIDEAPIVSHVANQAYREHVDEMTCEYPGCKRWKVGDGSEFCQEHGEGYVMSFPLGKRRHLQFDAYAGTVEMKDTP